MDKPYLMETHDMAGRSKTGDEMFDLMKVDKEMIEGKYDCEVIAWCTDEGPDSKKGKRLLGEAFLWMIILVCWAHQINLIVGDLLGLDHKLIKVIEMALEIIKWFNAHSDPLHWLNVKQELTYGKSLVVFLPVVTRWLVHYHTITRLLKIEESVQALWHRKQDAIIAKAGNSKKQNHAHTMLTPIGDGEFWKKLQNRVSR
jgi:hypothetical protein